MYYLLDIEKLVGTQCIIVTGIFACKLDMCYVQRNARRSIMYGWYTSTYYIRRIKAL